jgi:hypothetical protein
MQSMVSLMLLLGTGCCSAPPLAQEVPFLAIPPAMACPAPVLLTPTASPPEVAALKRDYAATAAPTIKAVIAPGATAQSVREVHAADRAARRSLVMLEREGSHPTPEQLRIARDAVRALRETLDDPPKD